MITANTITCTSTVDPPNYVEFVRNWATTVTCEMPEPSITWTAVWQAIAALATLVAVGVAVWQVRTANDAAEAAREGQSQALLALDEQRKDERYRRASGLSAWIAITDRDPVLHVMNGSEDAMYDVVVYHDGLAPLGMQRYSIVPPGFEGSVGLPRWYPAGENLGQPIQSGLVRITMTDPLGHKYERNPEFNGALSELGPCHE